MKKFYVYAGLCFSVLWHYSAFANCSNELGSDGKNQIGSIALFRAKDGGIVHPNIDSDYWALIGPQEGSNFRAIAIRMTSSVKIRIEGGEFDTWGKNPWLLHIRANALEIDDNDWLEIVEIYDNRNDLENGRIRYDQPTKGTCGSYFRDRW